MFLVRSRDRWNALFAIPLLVRMASCRLRSVRFVVMGFMGAVCSSGLRVVMGLLVRFADRIFNMLSRVCCIEFDNGVGSVDLFLALRARKVG